jgi:hypothetical protein
MDKVHKSSVPSKGGARSGADILRFFDGFELVDPGLVYIPLRRPDSRDVPADPGKFWVLAGVARKPAMRIDGGNPAR